MAARFHVEDILDIEDFPDDHASLTARLGEIIYNSTNIRAEVEELSAETGEFRVAILGTLDGPPPAMEQRSLPDAESVATEGNSRAPHRQGPQAGWFADGLARAPRR
jgi:hypothetical protein